MSKRLARSWPRTVLLCVIAGAFPVSPGPVAFAQASTRVLSGAVFDSATGTPLAGAVVQLVRLDQRGAPTRATATIANDRGRYRIEGVEPGRYLIGFQHEALSAFGLEAPAWRVDVSASTTTADSNVVVDLATPSAAELRADLCSSSEGAGGLIAGRVADGRSGAPLEGAAVTVTWSELAIQADTLRPRSVERTSRVRADGTYLICGASTDGLLVLTVAKDGYFTLRSDVAIPNAGVIRRDHTLAQIARSLGSGRVTGRVMRSDGTPLSSARVAIPALALDQAVINGRFSLNRVPNGRWLLEVRALGFVPWERLFEVSAQGSEEVTVAMAALPQTLEASRVVAPRLMTDDLMIRGILERSRISAGTMFLPGNPWLRDALFPADVVRAARGFTYTNPTTISARLTAEGTRCELAGSGLPAAPMGRGKASTGIAEKKTIALYVDGERFRGGLLALNDFLPMQDILAIETYPDVMSAPFIWRSTEACAVIAVWSKKDR